MHPTGFVGSWKTFTKVWWGGPGTPPSDTYGTAEVKWVLGKRFLLEEMNAKTPMPDPGNPREISKVPSQGIRMIGYDNTRNLYTGTWAHTVGTDIQTMQGGVDPSGKLFRMYGEMDEPMLNVYGRMVKFVTRIVNDNKHLLEIVDLHASDDYKVMEITYTRK